MRRTLTLLATVAFALSMASAAGAAPCKDAQGKFTKCPATAAAAGSYTLDAKGNCHDATGKMAKKALCGASASAAPSAAPSAATAGSPASAQATTSSTMTTASSGAGPKCTKGKRCGNACISVKDVCHK
jgi:hypothetical protein